MALIRFQPTLAVSALTALCLLNICAISTGETEASLLTRTGVTNYQKWTKVNPKPVIFHAAFAGQCAVFTSNLPSLHRDKYITVYVNDMGKRAMLTQEKPTFPIGSVIVKEKKATLKASPELLTVMVKREKGFNSGNGDWEYAVLDGSATQIQAQGQLSNCQTCHQEQKGMDYTFRDNYFVWPPHKHRK